MTFFCLLNSASQFDTDLISRSAAMFFSGPVVLVMSPPDKTEDKSVGPSRMFFKLILCF